MNVVNKKTSTESCCDYPVQVVTKDKERRMKTKGRLTHLTDYSLIVHIYWQAFRVLAPVLPHLNLLWELVITAEPLVVMALSPTTAANTVQTLVRYVHLSPPPFRQ